VACIPTDYIKMDRCFWEVFTSDQAVKKNRIIVDYYSITISGDTLIIQQAKNAYF
jgi:hypothetical protein